MGGLLPVARKYVLSSYEASYLHLALRHGLSLATRDEKLKAAAKKADAWELRVGLEQPGTPPKQLTLDAFPLRIGRAGGCALQLPDPLVSAEHAEIQLEGGQAYVMDLRSTNGTRRNGEPLVPLAPVALASSETFRLANGLEVVLNENHASPMAAAMVFVKAGSNYEQPQQNGVTHFLEHLLFNGTSSRSQEQIEPVIESFGGYINAFTRKELTGYLVLMPREYIDTGLAVMSDMIFSSIFPAEKVEKEGELRVFNMLTIAGTLFLGAGLPACVTTPKAQEPGEVSVSFVFIGHHDSVCLSADFNGWSSDSHCLKQKGDEWSIQLVLPPGRYRYGFVIDKRDWAWDPEALIQEEDGFGKRNSVLLIDAGVTKRLPGP